MVNAFGVYVRHSQVGVAVMDPVTVPVELIRQPTPDRRPYYGRAQPARRAAPAVNRLMLQGKVPSENNGAAKTKRIPRQGSAVDDEQYPGRVDGYCHDPVRQLDLPPSRGLFDLPGGRIGEFHDA